MRPVKKLMRKSSIVCVYFYMILLGKLRLNRQELAAEDYGSAESSQNGGILHVIPIFRTARMGQKIRCPAEDDLFRGSLAVEEESCFREEYNALLFF